MDISQKLIPTKSLDFSVMLSDAHVKLLAMSEIINKLI
jgi:hypothetical protein